jgi:hypothetical protein
MCDLVGTCPKHFWEEWILEGDPAGEPWSGNEWSWCTHHGLATHAKYLDRFYVVAHGKLRGYAPVIRVDLTGDGGFEIIRKGNAVACTIPEPIPGFRGLRLRWWKREDETSFPEWKIP